MTPGSVIVARVGSGPQLHTDIATHPEAPPPYGRDVSGRHLSSFLYLSEEYQVRVQAETALGEAAEVRLDTIELQRGGMLLMVATSRHHGMPALHRHHQPNTTHLDPTPPLDALAVAGGLSSGECPIVDQVLWLGKGAIGRVGLWEGDAAEALFADAPEAPSSGPPTRPYHPTFLSRSAPADVLAVLEVAEHSVLFFAGLVHQLEVTKDGQVDESEAIHFAISGVAPAPPPSGPPRCGTQGTPPRRGAAPSPRVPGPGPSAARAIIRCAPCAIVLVCLLFRQICRNSHEICTNFVRISCPRMYGASV